MHALECDKKLHTQDSVPFHADEHEADVHGSDRQAVCLVGVTRQSDSRAGFEALKQTAQTSIYCAAFRPLHDFCDFNFPAELNEHAPPLWGDEK